MSNFEVIIGIEIHLELNTKTKMFSSAPNKFNQPENTLVNPLDIAYPGTMPVVNKGAVIRAIKLAKALNMEIDSLIRFDRKNYFYPDLPKGFQITQQFFPIGKNGIAPIKDRKISIERIHMEEDTAKAFHEKDLTLLNYNRAGVPLIEIVSNPVMHNEEEAVQYIEMIRNIAWALNISEAKMEEGSMRADINISLRPYGQEAFGTKVEIKNLNSLSNISKAIAFEIKLQTKQYLLGEKVVQTTKRFDETTQENKVMRVKSGELDYKYMVEPNIVPIKLEQKFIDQIIVDEMPWEKEARYLKANVKADYAKMLSTDPKLSSFFDQINYQDKEKLAKVFFAEIIAIANKENKDVSQLNIKPDDITKVLDLVAKGTISGKHMKAIFPLLLKGQGVEEIIEKNNMQQISDEKELTKIINVIIEESNDFIKNNKERNEKIVKYILGQLMKKTQGQANPVISMKIVERLLK